LRQEKWLEIGGCRLAVEGNEEKVRRGFYLQAAASRPQP
jgi:hypothetical protein